MDSHFTQYASEHLLFGLENLRALLQYREGRTSIRDEVTMRLPPSMERTDATPCYFSKTAWRTA